VIRQLIDQPWVTSLGRESPASLTAMTASLFSSQCQTSRKLSSVPADFCLRISLSKQGPVDQCLFSQELVPKSINLKACATAHHFARAQHRGISAASEARCRSLRVAEGENERLRRNVGGVKIHCSTAMIRDIVWQNRTRAKLMHSIYSASCPRIWPPQDDLRRWS
jgi:hypothetical protein